MDILAINNAWGSVFAPSHFPQNGLNAPTLEDVNKADTNVADGSNEAPSAQPGSENDNPRDEIEDLANKRTLTTDDFRRGFVLTSIGTNEVHDFSPSENAIIDSDWRAFGAAEDWSYLSFNDWAFLLGTNEIERLRVCSYGEVDPVASFTNTYFAPFQSKLGVVPASNWHLLDEADRPSQFWHEMTSLNTLKLTWQNVLYNRSTNTPVCFQMELWPNGNFAYRYNLSKAGLWNGEAISNIFVGAVCEGLEKSVDISSLTNLTSLAFYRLDPDDMPATDRDEDGLSIEDELFIYHTDPNCWDSDFDGISDGGEVGLKRVMTEKARIGECENAVMREVYREESSGVVASYTYDAFGKLIAKFGPLADFFRHRFSTKYFDVESNLYYYGYRFYHPALMRWLNRDPIEEDGGLNLYGFCGNNGVVKYDKFGLAHFEVRKLSGAPGIIPYSCFGAIIGLGSALALDLGLANKWNIEILHEHLFYDDGTNVGYGEDGKFSEKSKDGYKKRDSVHYDDCIMREAEKRVKPPPYSLIGWGKPKYNCQDYADALRQKYEELKNDNAIKCKCKKGESNVK